MNATKNYTVEEIQNLLGYLDNSTGPRNGKMKRIKLPVPAEYGGGWATGNTIEEAIRRIIDRVRDQIAPPISVPTFEECYEKWMEIKKGQMRSESTIANYEDLARRRLLPFFKGKLISEITPDDIQLYFNSIIHLSKSYSNQNKTVLSSIFERAERNGYIDRNPMRFTYERSKREKQKVVLQDEDLLEVISQLDNLSGREYLYACLLCFTALRRGEILGLRWKDIDFENEELTVRNNVTFPNGDNNPIVRAPKDDSFGVVHLQTLLAARIKPYRTDPEDYVIACAEDRTKPITRSSFTKMFESIRRKIDLKGATSHSFRASYVTMMNAHCDRVDPKALQGALRHKTPDLAIKVYTKSNDNKTRTAEIEYDEYLCNQLAK